MDVTEQKAAESEAELQRQEVAHLTRVTVMGELSGAIAHEVNQPLTAILSNAQAALHLLAPETPNHEEIRGALEDIVQEDNRAGDIIQRLRGLLKKGESKFETVNLNRLVEATITLLRHEVIARRVSIESVLAVDLSPVLGDAIQLQQVLLNLIMNSMDAMASIPTHSARSRSGRVLRPPESSRCLSRIVGQESNRRIASASSFRSILPRSAALGLVYPSARRSSRSTVEKSNCGIS